MGRRLLVALLVLAFLLSGQVFAAAKTQAEPAQNAGLSKERVTRRLTAAPDGAVSPAAIAPMSEAVPLQNGFEISDWPAWTLYGNGWGQTSFRAYSGSYSAYCASYWDEGPGPYPSNMDSWMVIGPFDLSAADSVFLRYQVWASMDASDYLAVGASTDGEIFDCLTFTGITNGWITHGVNFGDFGREPQVWFAFEFVSDEADEAEGVYLDSVRLECTNWGPTANSDWYSIHPNQTKVVAAPGILANDEDEDQLTAVKVTEPTLGTVDLNADGSFTYVPFPDATGSDSFTYRALDGTGNGSTATVGIHIGNLPPEGGGAVTTPINTPVSGVIETWDAEGDPVTVTLLTQPEHGTIVCAPNGAFTYTPAPGWYGRDFVFFRASDGDQSTDNNLMFFDTIAPNIPVFRFYNVTNGTHFFTPSAEERDMVISRWPKIFTYEGVAYYTNPNRNTQPLYRFYNRSNGSHFYTASLDEANSVVAKWSNVFTYDGPTYPVSISEWSDCIPVYRFYNKMNGSHFYTASAEEADTVIAKWSATYTFEGPAFWLAQ